MSRVLVSLLLLTLASPAAGQVDYAQLTIRERVIIRVPRMSPTHIRSSRPIRWEESKGPKCIPAAALAGALLSERKEIDLVLRGGRRVRAKLEGNCHGLDFYHGFYVKPSADGMICADRDVVRSRSGAKCPIDRFRLLTPKR